MKIGRVSKNQIDSILYVSSYQEAFNPKIAANKIATTLNFVNGDLSQKDNETNEKHGKHQSLYQESFGNDNSVQNFPVNKILNADPHGFGKKNILYHQYTPGNYFI